MKIFKNVFLFSLICFLVIFLTFCYEDKHSLMTRYNLSKQIFKYSSNKIKLSVSQTDGISCFANDFINYQQSLITIPKNLTLCAYYLFPFKYEILAYILESPGVKDITKSDKLSMYLLSYYLLYYMNAKKEEVKKYLIEKKMTQYYNCDEIDDFLKNYFPKEISGHLYFSDEHFRLLKSLGYDFLPYEEIENIFKHIYSKFYISEHKNIVIPWISNLNHLKWAYSIILTRSFNIQLDLYLILNDIDITKKIFPSVKKNLDVNNKFFSKGSLCLIPFIDLINHYQPRETNKGKISRQIFINTEKNNFIYGSSSDYIPSQELQHTYVDEVNNVKLLRNYGFVFYNNNFNNLQITINDNSDFNISQIKLCKELNCADLKIQDSNNLSKTKIYKVRLASLDEKLLNFSRVKFLNNNFDVSTVLKNIYTTGIISKENEIKAMTYYFNLFYHLINNFTSLFENLVSKCHKYRIMLRNILKYWIHSTNEEIKKEEYNRIKSFENIYILDISYKKIVIKQMLGSINQLILNIKDDINHIKFKYI